MHEVLPLYPVFNVLTEYICHLRGCNVLTDGWKTDDHNLYIASKLLSRGFITDFLSATLSKWQSSDSKILKQ